MAHFEKKYMIEELSNYFKNSSALIITNFDKMNVVGIDSLRRKLEKSSTRFVVAKNTLFKIALSRLNLDKVTPYIKGVSGIAVCKEDPVCVAKTLFEFSKDNESFKICGGFVEGQILDADKTKELSQLPGKEQLRARVVIQMKSPITRLVSVLSGTIRGFIVTLDKISKQKADKIGG